MNISDVVGPMRNIWFRVWRAITVQTPARRISAFGASESQISSILVVNLDRQPQRWRRVIQELGRFRTSDGRRLTAITRRLSAIDARDGRAVAATSDVDPMYRIGDQLYVQPDARLAAAFDSDEPVRMTRQEIAVARSHIEAWKVVAEGTDDFVLILEDDAWFRPRARSSIDRGWQAALARSADAPGLVYFSYADAGGTAVREEACEDAFRPVRGLWFLSGYVLSREGASRLLRAMPVVGPVDLWMNFRFAEVGAFALTSPAIAQRHDARSDNSYSMLPYLARAGVIDGAIAAKPPVLGAAGPVLAWTDRSRPESLAMALSMLGLRVCAFDDDGEPLDVREVSEVLRTFDALVNAQITASALNHALARDEFVILCEEGASLPPGLALTASGDARAARVVPVSSGGAEWNDMCEQLRVPQPVDDFPVGAPSAFRIFRDDRTRRPAWSLNRGGTWPMDESPWILPPASRWEATRMTSNLEGPPGPVLLEADLMTPSPVLLAMKETFPGNLAGFAPQGIAYGRHGAQILLEVDEGALRRYRSGALISARPFLHGRFQSEIRAAAGPGLVTGFFLHRGSPRQEIDIEFVGSDPRRMLTNVYFNPGDDGASLSYGYRGSPHWIELGFDATEDFHEYAIEWRGDRVAWLVDGKVVHSRGSWDPTPIPHLAMNVHANLWAPRSHELAGPINENTLPAGAAFRNVVVTG